MKNNHPFFGYYFFSALILGWWAWAFYKAPPPIYSPAPSEQSLLIKTEALFGALSPLQRDSLKQALAGNFNLMLELIEAWDSDAQYLVNQGIKGIKRIDKDAYLQAHILGHLIQNGSSHSLQEINCRMSLKTPQSIYQENLSRKFLPQTHLSATFLLAIAPYHEILALPKGLRHVTELIPLEISNQIPHDHDHLQSETLFLNQPDLAFIAPYSHPPTIELLRNQKIALYSIKGVETLAEIPESLLQIGHATQHILEAQLLAIFIESSFLSIDNRLEFFQQNHKLSSSLRLLYLSYHENYTIPTTKSITGQLMERALAHYTQLAGDIPAHTQEWHIPAEQEKIAEASPDVIIVSTPLVFTPPPLNLALSQTKAFHNSQIAYIDEAIQESPTQYTALAYFDIFQAILACL